MEAVEEEAVPAEVAAEPAEWEAPVGMASAVEMAVVSGAEAFEVEVESASGVEEEAAEPGEVVVGMGVKAVVVGMAFQRVALTEAVAVFQGDTLADSRVVPAGIQEDNLADNYQGTLVDPPDTREDSPADRQGVALVVVAAVAEEAVVDTAFEVEEVVV